MKRRLSSFFSKFIIGSVLGLIGCLGFTSCKSRVAKTITQDGNERPDTTSVTKPRTLPDNMGMVMYGTPTTTFEPKQIVVPKQTEVE